MSLRLFGGRGLDSSRRNLDGRGIVKDEQIDPQVTELEKTDMPRKPHFSHKESSLVRSYYRVYKRVLAYFGNSVVATDWMFTPNILLGGKSPLDMINDSQSKRLENWIIAQIDENEEPTRPIGFSK